MSNLIVVFNDHFMEFLGDVQSIYPEDANLMTAKNSFQMMRKSNPKMLVKVWNQYVVIPYKTQIEEGNLEYFLTQDYSQFIPSENSEKILGTIQQIKGLVQQMSPENKQKSMKYIQNLTKLAGMISAQQSSVHIKND